MTFLHNEIKNHISGKRYEHTICVERECRKLAKIYGLSEAETDKLRIAALLHDITKEYDQYELTEEYGIEEERNHSILHALTGAEFAKRNFSPIVDDIVYNAIKCHTTGRENMNIIDKLLLLADYIEESRKIKSCVKLRKYFYTNVNKSDPVKVLDDCLIKAFDDTLKHLIKQGYAIDCMTVKSRNYLLTEKNEKKL